MPVLQVKNLGLVEYQTAWSQMQEFTAARDEQVQDQLWLLQHPPVFTLGMNGKHEHVLTPGDIPVIDSDRGGQVTYHGPGQLVAYVLLDIRRKNMGIRDLVTQLEQSVIQWLAEEGVDATARQDAPGVYVKDAKVAALGLRVKRGCSYHGMSLNVDMDLEPFSRINPCGQEGLAVTRTLDLGINYKIDEVAERWSKQFAAILGYTLHP